MSGFSEIYFRQRSESYLFLCYLEAVAPSLMALGFPMPSSSSGCTHSVPASQLGIREFRMRQRLQGSVWMSTYPALQGMVEYTAPHPETPARGNIQVNNVTPRCLRQEHSFTDQVGMHSAGRCNPISRIHRWIHSTIS